MTPSRRWAAAAALIVLTGTAGCGGNAATPPPGRPTTTSPLSATPGSSAPSAPGTAPSAAATETNPPGDIPDNQAYVAFTPPGSRVSVKVPEGWARSTVGAATVFADKLNRIEVATGRVTAAPTVSSVAGSEVAKLASTVPKFSLGKVTADHRTAGPVIVVTYQGDSAQGPVTGKVVREACERYTYVNQGRRLDLTLSGPTNADNVDPWRIVSDSVRWQ